MHDYSVTSGNSKKNVYDICDNLYEIMEEQRLQSEKVCSNNPDIMLDEIEKDNKKLFGLGQDLQKDDLFLSGVLTLLMFQLAEDHYKRDLSEEDLVHLPKLVEEKYNILMTDIKNIFTLGDEYSMIHELNHLKDKLYIILLQDLVNKKNKAVTEIMQNLLQTKKTNQDIKRELCLN